MARLNAYCPTCEAMRSTEKVDGAQCVWYNCILCGYGIAYFDPEDAS